MCESPVDCNVGNLEMIYAKDLEYWSRIWII